MVALPQAVWVTSNVAAEAGVKENAANASKERITTDDLKIKESTSVDDLGLLVAFEKITNFLKVAHGQG